jgi:hypothetical protein
MKKHRASTANKIGRRALLAPRLPIEITDFWLTWRVMLARFCAADHELTAKEFFVVQFLYRTLRFLDGLHLDKSETFRALIVPVTYNFRVLDVTNTVKQFEEIALRGIE